MDTRSKNNLTPPYYPHPESAQAIKAIHFTVMLIPTIILTFIYSNALAFMATWIVILSLILSKLLRPLEKKHLPGQPFEDASIALLTWYMLPVNTSWLLVTLAIFIAIALGRLIIQQRCFAFWQPAVIAAVLMTLIFRQSPEFIQAQSVLQPLRDFTELTISGIVPDLGQYMYNQLNPIEAYLFGQQGGMLIDSCRFVLIIVGIYFIYRGYLHWQMPFFYIVTFYLTAAVMPIPVKTDAADTTIYIWLPLLAENLTTGLSYVHYQLFTGTAILTAFILFTDMNSRPINLKGQIYFVILTAILSVVFKLYTSIPMPCLVALFITQTAVPYINTVTRRHGRKA